MNSSHAAPNFVIIGAMKAGTTLLWDVLNQHPDVYMSKRKEPHYFSYLAAGTQPLVLEGANPPVTGATEYAALFDEAGTARAVGEASTSYLHTPGVAELLQARLPNAKLICVLRNPVERAYSHYLFLVRQGVETLPTFAEALDAEETRAAQGLSYGRYTTIGCYHAHLQPYLARFPRRNIHLCLFEDLIRPPEESYYPTIFRFLEIDPTFRADTSILRNPSGLPKYKWLEALFDRNNPLRRVVEPWLPRRLYRFATTLRDRNLVKPPMPREVRQRLVELFRSDILALQDLMGRDLSSWLRV